jgi:hypothetical protein
MIYGALPGQSLLVTSDVEFDSTTFVEFRRQRLGLSIGDPTLTLKEHPV